MNIDKIVRPLNRIVEQLTQGIEKNIKTITTNTVTISSLEEANEKLTHENTRARTVADNILKIVDLN